MSLYSKTQFQVRVCGFFAREFSGCVIYGTHPEHRSRLFQTTVRVPVGTTTFELSVCEHASVGPGQWRVLCYAQDKNWREEPCEFLEAVGVVERWPSEGSLDISLRVVGEPDDTPQTEAKLTFTVVSQQQLKVPESVPHPRAFYQPDTWSAAALAPDTALRQQLQRAYPSAEPLFQASDQLNSFYRTHVPALTPRTAVPVWFYFYRCWSEQTRYLRHPRDSQTFERHLQQEIQVWYRHCGFSDLDSLQHTRALSFQHVKLLHRVLCNFCWQAPYRSDSVIIVPDGIDKEESPCEDFGFLRVRPHPQLTAGDCEDCSIEIGLLFQELVSEAFRPREATVLVLQKVARQYCLCHVDATLNNSSGRLGEEVESDPVDQISLHQCVLLVPWQSEVLEPYRAAALEAVDPEAELPVVLCEGTELITSQLADEPTEPEVRELEEWLFDGREPQPKPAHGITTGSPEHFTLRRTRSLLSCRAAFKRQYYRALLRCYCPALFEKFGITSFLPRGKSSEDAFRLRPGVSLAAFMATPEAFTWLPLQTLTREDALWQSWAHFALYELPLVFPRQGTTLKNTALPPIGRTVTLFFRPGDLSWQTDRERLLSLLQRHTVCQAKEEPHTHSTLKDHEFCSWTVCL